MKVSFRMMSSMELECSPGPMARATTVGGELARGMDKAYTKVQMVMSVLEFGKMMSNREMLMKTEIESIIEDLIDTYQRKLRFY